MLFDGLKSLMWVVLLAGSLNNRATNPSSSATARFGHHCDSNNITTDTVVTALPVPFAPTPIPTDVPTIRIEPPTYSPTPFPSTNGRKGKTSPPSPSRSSITAEQAPRPSPALLTTPPSYLIYSFRANVGLTHGPQRPVPTRVPSRVPLPTAPPTILHPIPLSTAALLGNMSLSQVFEGDVEGEGPYTRGTWGMWGGIFLSTPWVGVYTVMSKWPGYLSATSPVFPHPMATASSPPTTTQSSTDGEVASTTGHPTSLQQPNATLRSNGTPNTGSEREVGRTVLSIIRSTSCGEDGSTVITTISTTTQVTIVPPGSATCRPQPAKNTTTIMSIGGVYVGQRVGVDTSAATTGDTTAAPTAPLLHHTPAHSMANTTSPMRHPEVADTQETGEAEAGLSGAWWCRGWGGVRAVWAHVLEGVHGLPIFTSHQLNDLHVVDESSGNTYGGFNNSANMTSRSGASDGGRRSPIIKMWGVNYRATRVGGGWQYREGNATPTTMPYAVLRKESDFTTPITHVTARRDAAVEARGEAGCEVKSSHHDIAITNLSTGQQNVKEEESHQGGIVEKPHVDVLKARLEGIALDDPTLPRAIQYIYTVVGGSVRIARGIRSDAPTSVPNSTPRKAGGADTRAADSQVPPPFLTHATFRLYLETLQWCLWLARGLIWIYLIYKARTGRTSCVWRMTTSTLPPFLTPEVLEEMLSQASSGTLPASLASAPSSLPLPSTSTPAIGSPTSAPSQSPLSLLRQVGLPVMGPIVASAQQVAAAVSTLYHSLPRTQPAIVPQPQEQPQGQGQLLQMGPIAEVVLLLQGHMHQQELDADTMTAFLIRMTMCRVCLGEIGSGGQGTVFKYQDTSGKLFALKTMSFRPAHPMTPFEAQQYAIDARRRAASEVIITSIMGVYSFATHVEDSALTSSGGMILMGYADGVDAHKYITLVMQGQMAAPSAQMVEGFVLELLRAIKVCKGHNIVHKDLKTANVIIKVQNGTMVPIIVDWGLACQNASHTPNNAEGTATYLDADSLRGVGMTRCARDVFAVGLIITQLAKRTTNVWIPTTEARMVEAQQSALVGTFAHTHADLPALIKEELERRLLPELAAAMLAKAITPATYVALRETLHADPDRREGLLDWSVEQLEEEGQREYGVAYGGAVTRLEEAMTRLNLNLHRNDHEEEEEEEEEEEGMVGVLGYNQ